MKKRFISFLLALTVLASFPASVLAASAESPQGGYVHSADGTALYRSSDGYDWYLENAELISVTPAEAPDGLPQTTAEGRTIFYFHFEYLVTCYLGTAIFNKPTIVFKVKMLAVEYLDNSSGYRFLENEGVTVSSYSNFAYVNPTVTVDRVDYFNHEQSFQIDVTASARLSSEDTTHSHSFTLEADIEDHV